MWLGRTHCSGKKLVVGTQLGSLSLWAPSRGLLDHVDRFPGHPASVDALCTLDEDTVLTGSSDGLIRVVQLFPHKLLGIVGDHGGMPVECVKRKGNMVASLGHGSECKLTDLQPLLEGEDEEDTDAPQVLSMPRQVPHLIARSTEASDNDSDVPPPSKRRGKNKAKDDSNEVRANFFADM